MRSNSFTADQSAAEDGAMEGLAEGTSRFTLQKLHPDSESKLGRGEDDKHQNRKLEGKESLNSVAGAPCSHLETQARKDVTW